MAQQRPPLNRRLVLCEVCGRPMSGRKSMPDFTVFYCFNPACANYRQGQKKARANLDPARLEAENAALRAENAVLRQRLASE